MTAKLKKVFQFNDPAGNEAEGTDTKWIAADNEPQAIGHALANGWTPVFQQGTCEIFTDAESRGAMVGPTFNYAALGCDEVI